MVNEVLCLPQLAVEVGIPGTSQLDSVLEPVTIAVMIIIAIL